MPLCSGPHMASCTETRSAISCHLAKLVEVVATRISVAKRDIAQESKRDHPSCHDAIVVNLHVVEIGIGRNLDFPYPPQLDLVDQCDYLVKALVEVRGQPLGSEHAKKAMGEEVAARLDSIEGTDVRVADRFSVLQPVQTCIDGAPIPTQDIGFVLRIDLVALFAEADTIETSDAVNDGVLEKLERRDEDGGRNQLWAKQIGVQELLPQLVHFRIHRHTLGKMGSFQHVQQRSLLSSGIGIPVRDRMRDSKLQARASKVAA